MLRQRKVPKRKATHSLRPLRVATGQTCVGALAGCAVELATRWRAALGQPRRVRLRGMRAKAPMLTPQTPRRRRSQKGVGSRTARQPNSHTGHCCARPSLRSARRLRPGGSGRAQRRPVWMSGFGFPSGCAEERSGQRIRARDCLSEASSSETPLDASTAGCPQRSEGTQRVGSPFFWVRFFGEAKKSTSPAGARPGLRPEPRHAPRHAPRPNPISPQASTGSTRTGDEAFCYQKNSCFRLMHKRQSQKSINPPADPVPATHSPPSPAPSTPPALQHPPPRAPQPPHCATPHTH